MPPGSPNGPIDRAAASKLPFRSIAEGGRAMASLVLGAATSHTPMLNAPPEDWPRFIERDRRRSNLLDTDGNPTTYEAQLARAPAAIAGEITAERMRRGTKWRRRRSAGSAPVSRMRGSTP